MTTRRRLGFSIVSIATVVAAMLVGAQLAPAAERGDFGGETRGSAVEFVGRATQNGFGISIVGYVTRVADVSEADLFNTNSPFARNENTARITFTANTAISQSFMVLPANPTLFDVNSTGNLTFYFTASPGAQRLTRRQGLTLVRQLPVITCASRMSSRRWVASIRIAVSSTAMASCVKRPCRVPDCWRDAPPWPHRHTAEHLHARLDHPNQPESAPVSDAVRRPHYDPRRRSVLTQALANTTDVFFSGLERKPGSTGSDPGCSAARPVAVPAAHGAVVSAGPPVLPLLMLTTVGRASGQDRTVPLLYMDRVTTWSS